MVKNILLGIGAIGMAGVAVGLAVQNKSNGDLIKQWREQMLHANKVAAENEAKGDIGVGVDAPTESRPFKENNISYFGTQQKNKPVTEEIKETVEPIVDEAKDVVEEVKEEVIGPVVKEVKEEVVEPVIETVRTVVDKVEDGSEEAISIIKDSAKPVVEDIVEVAIDSKDIAKEDIEEVKDDIDEKLASAFEALDEKNKEIGEALGSHDKVGVVKAFQEKRKNKKEK